MKNYPDLSKANTESFYRFIKFHEELNDIIRINTASIQTFKRITNVNNGDILIGSLIDSCDKPWGKNKKYPKFNNIINNTIVNNSNLYLVYVLTGFDWFTFNIVKDMALFSNTLRTHIHPKTHTDFLTLSDQTFDEDSSCCFKSSVDFTFKHKLKNRLNKFKSILNINDVEFDKNSMLFDFIRAIRNCIAHSNSYPNDELIKIYNKQPLQKLLASDKTLQMYLPKISKSVQIILTEENAIFASYICLLLAKKINQEVVKSIDIDGYIKTVIYYFLYVKIYPSTMKRYRDFYSLFIDYFDGRYRIKGIERDGLIKLIKKNKDYLIIKEKFKNVKF